MLTRTFLIIPYPSIQSNLRAILNLQGEGTIVGTLTILSIEKFLFPLQIGVRIGDKHAVFECTDMQSPFTFNMVGDINSSIIVALGTTTKGTIQTIGAVDTDNLKFDNSIYIKDSVTKPITPPEESCPHTNNSTTQSIDTPIQNFTNPQELSNDKSHLYTDYSTPSDTDSSTKINSSFSLFQSYDTDNSSLYTDYSDSEVISLNQNPNTPTDNPLNIDNVILGDTNFYNLIYPQLNHLFNNYPRFTKLENLVQNTEWIKVSYTDNGEGHYILGKLFENGVVAYICYGIPSNSRLTPPPADLIEYCQWLPLEPTNVDGEGYWVMYQSAETGENFRL